MRSAAFGEEKPGRRPEQQVERFRSETSSIRGGNLRFAIRRGTRADA
jgi:hypothetical protein